MPYPAHSYLQFGGTLGGGDGDIWSCGIRLGTYGGLGGDELDHEQYLDDTAVPALGAWMLRSDSQISLQARLRFAKCNPIGPDGKYSDPGTVHERFFPPIQGAAGGDVHPYQTCLVLTWGTADRTRGPGSTGRIYSPMPVIAIDGATGLFNSQGAQGAATSAAALINSLDAALGAVGGGVVRPSLVSPSGAGVKSQIDFVEVDNRTDTQRRRANAMDPVRSRVDVNY